MLIVLEGVDGVGKSTIARKLARILNARIIHCTKDTPNDYRYFHHILDAATNRLGCDRNIVNEEMRNAFRKWAREDPQFL